MRAGKGTTANVICAVAIVFPLVIYAPRAAARQPASRLPTYHVDVIQSPAGQYFGADINDRGEVALSGEPPADPSGFIAQRWDDRRGFLTLAPGLPPFSLSTGINKRGDVTVVHQAATGDFRFLSALWTDREGLTDLGTIGRQTWANDVNDHGVAVGWTERDTDARERYAFTWTRDGGMKTLSDLPGGRDDGAAFEITEKGLIVGSGRSALGVEAVRWVDGQIQGLGDLPGGLYFSIAFSANDRGQIVGVGHVEGDGRDLNGNGQPDPLPRAFLWSPRTGMINLGALQPDHESVAYDINEEGMVVGYSASRAPGTLMKYVPFVWTEESGMVDIHDLLDEQSAGWHLGALQMGRINESGQILLHGERDGQLSVVMLTPQNPEPGAFLMLAAACAVLGVRRGR